MALQKLFSPSRLLRVAGISGIACPLIALVSLWLAISLSPWFSWTAHSLSDLAGAPGERPIWSARGLPSIVFVASLAVEGGLAALFGIGLGRITVFRKGPGRLGRLVFLAGACALAATGLVPKTLGRAHAVFATSFFFLVPLSIVMIGLSLRKANPSQGRFTMTLGAIGLCPLVVPWPWKGAAIPDVISLAPMSAFTVAYGIWLLKLAGRLRTGLRT